MSMPCRVVFYNGDEEVFVCSENFGMFPTEDMYQRVLNHALNQWEFCSGHSFFKPKIEEKGHKLYGAEWDSVKIGGKMFKFIMHEGKRVLASPEKIAELESQKGDQG